jgi:hypothetical protein
VHDNVIFGSCLPSMSLILHFIDVPVVTIYSLI